MIDLVRDSFAGQIVRRCGGKRLLPYPDERPDYVIPLRYLGKTLDADNQAEKTGPHTTFPRRQSTEATIADVDLCHRPSQITPTPEEGDQRVERRVSLAEKKHILVDFEEGEGLNPMLWSFRKRCFVAFLVSFMTFSVYLGSAIYVPAIPSLQERFQIGPVHATLGLSLFIIGYGTGPILFSPLSEVPVLGRTTIYIVTLALYFIFQLPALWATNFNIILAMRFLTGFFGSPCLATGGASIADTWPEAKLPYAIMVWDLGAVCGPIIGPVAGGFAAQHKGWQWPLFELAWLSGCALIMLSVLLPETNVDTILLRKARRLRKLTGNPNIVSESELQQAAMSASDVLKSALIMPFRLTLEPIVAYINLFLALEYSIFYLWFEAFPLTFGDIYGFNLGLEGLTFISLAVGVFIFFAAYLLYYKYIVEPQEKILRPGDVRALPERRYLRVPLICSFLFPISLFWFGWSSRESVHWIVPCLAAVVYSPALESLFLGFLVYLPTTYPKYAASVLASNGLARAAAAAAFPLFGRTMYSKLTIGGGCSLLGGLSILFIPPLAFLYFQGYKLRRLSKYAAQPPETIHF